MFDTILVVGYGRIAEVLYLPYLLSLDCKIIVCEVNDDRREALLSLGSQVEVVSEIPFAEEGKKCAALNLSPVCFHAKINKELLEKKWNVFSEKTPADSEDEWEELVECALKNKCIISSAPVSANIAEEEKIEKDIRSGLFGDIAEIHCEFIGGGPARRGFISNQRKWMLAEKDAVRVDLAPYLIMPVISRIGSISNMQWFSNDIHPMVDIQDSDEKIKSICGTSEIGIGKINDSLLTVLVSYRTYVKDVVTTVEIVGTKEKKKYFLNEIVEEGKHSYDRVEQALSLVDRCISDSEYMLHHSKMIKNMLYCLQKGENK
ncbi:MAG: hypothetical protein K5898_15945 [Ruminococcus sp.]|uniref:Gfo/Idh/MocA family oxidoreductase n=1 Tax=Ruminococcus sp. TaxID=41978 RepID=UPI0025CC6431|nr:Gfo/Idh/MocA family oxidoreductase [Ruminococcus sp.]MCR4796631.1 hypothetical protein [Ruminococcus sp.]